jgi:hypothetical protein
VKEWRGTIDAELLPKERASVFRPARFELATSAFAALYHEVTDIFTTALPGASLRRAFGCWGTGDLGFQQSIRRCFLAKASQPATHRPRRSGSTVRLTTGGSRTRFTRREVSEIFTTSIHDVAIYATKSSQGNRRTSVGLAAFGDSEVTKFITTWNEELQMQQAKLINFVAALS